MNNSSRNDGNDSRTLRSKKLRAALFTEAGGRCRMCGDELQAGWHADHKTPWSKGGQTNVHDMQALCASCNQKKGASDLRPRGFWTQTRDVVVARFRGGKRKVTAGVECGGGKSALPGAVAYDLHRLGAIDAIIWAAPRKNLTSAAAEAMAPNALVWKLIGLHPSDAKRFEINHLKDGNVESPDKGAFGYAASYAALAADVSTHLHFMRRRRALLIGDEIQFIRDDVESSWRTAFASLMEQAAFTLLMSGDFEREDGARVYGVDYEPMYEVDGLLTNREQVVADIVYTIHDALNEKAIVPLDFSYGSGAVRWSSGNGRDWNEVASFPEAGPQEREALWAALNSQYADQLLTECVRSWQAHRTTGKLPNRQVRPNPKAQLMVVCANITQANRVKAFMVSELGLSDADIALVHSEEEAAGEELRRYCKGKVPIVITVQMAYVGTDAPGTTHLCCLTHIRSKAWIHQMLARVWRLTNAVSYNDDYAVVFCPDDSFFAEAVQWIKTAQLASIEVDEDETEAGAESQRSERERRSVIIDSSELTGVFNKYEISFEARGATNDTYTPEPQPDREQTAIEMRKLGWSETQIEAALRAATEPVAVPGTDPVYDDRPLADRIQDLRNQLEQFQRRTAFDVARVTGKQPDFATVQSKLIAFAGKGRESMSEAELRTALSRHAPRVRSLLIEAARGATP